MVVFPAPSVPSNTINFPEYVLFLNVNFRIGLSPQDYFIFLLEERYGKDRILSVKQPTDMSRKTKLFQKMMYSKNHEELSIIVLFNY